MVLFNSKQSAGTVSHIKTDPTQKMSQNKSHSSGEPTYKVVLGFAAIEEKFRFDKISPVSIENNSVLCKKEHLKADFQEGYDLHILAFLTNFHGVKFYFPDSMKKIVKKKDGNVKCFGAIREKPCYGWYY